MPSFGEIARSALRYFLPGWLVAMVGSTLVFAPSTFGELGWIQIKLLTAFTASVVTGHALTLSLLRRWFRADVEVAGRKSFVAGLCSVGGLLITSMTVHGGRGYGIAALTYLGVGAVVTAAIYFPWIRQGTTAAEEMNIIGEQRSSQAAAGLPPPDITARVKSKADAAGERLKR